MPSRRYSTAFNHARPRDPRRQDLPANLAGLHRGLPDHGRRLRRRCARGLRLVFICPLLRASKSGNSAGAAAETSSRPSQVREPKLRCRHRVLGSCFRNDASMTPSDQMNRMARATFGNKGRSLEHASVANERQEPDEFGPVPERHAPRRDAVKAGQHATGRLMRIPAAAPRPSGARARCWARAAAGRAIRMRPE